MYDQIHICRFCIGLIPPCWTRKYIRYPKVGYGSTIDPCCLCHIAKKGRLHVHGQCASAEIRGGSKGGPGWPCPPHIRPGHPKLKLASVTASMDSTQMWLPLQNLRHPAGPPQTIMCRNATGRNYYPLISGLLVYI
jgi:hypothetical protein